jgi:hypothetical protein
MSDNCMKWFIGEPPCNGWYFYSPKREDYDLARPVPVIRIENPTGIRLAAILKGEQVDCELLKDGIWCGPVPVLGHPPEWMRKGTP